MTKCNFHNRKKGGAALAAAVTITAAGRPHLSTQK
ncbi:hypothetical protein HMPREF1221_02332 [Treponema socranskii subsp. paredis ATCC 35535]|nr:hypothetical protein HMPREF1221_02332 [Treponema socranskii subsp. paredis ATCC 35535]